MHTISNIKQFILLEVFLPIGDIVMKTKVHYYYHLIKKMNTWSQNEINDWQNNKLQMLVRHFYDNTVYYRTLLNELKIKPEDIKTKKDLLKIPPLTKQIISKHYSKLIPANLNDIKHKKAATGGSVKTLKYLLDLNSWSFTTAMKIYSWQSFGYHYGDKYATFGSTSLFASNKSSLKHNIYHLFKSSVRLSSMNLTEKHFQLYATKLKKQKVKYLYGYASAIYLLSKYCNLNDIKIDTIKGCFTTSEVLTDSYRKEIENCFGYVMDCYGARDGGVTAFEISKKEYHVGYNSIIETYNEFEENTGTLLVTDLLNYAFPFIRYEVGDEIMIKRSEQNSKYNGQIIGQIFGRSPDIIRFQNGTVLVGPAFYHMFGSYHVSAYKIIKTGESELTVQIQKESGFNLDEEKSIIKTLKKHAGEDCNIKIEYLTFSEEDNSKRRFIMLD